MNARNGKEKKHQATTIVAKGRRNRPLYVFNIKSTVQYFLSYNLMYITILKLSLNVIFTEGARRKV